MLLTDVLTPSGGRSMLFRARRAKPGKTLIDTLTRSESQTHSPASSNGTVSFGVFVQTKLAAGKAALQQLRSNQIAPLFTDPRRQQREAIASPSAVDEMSAAEQPLNRDLVLALTSLGFASAGALFYAPLSLLSIPGIGWVFYLTSKDAYQALKAGRGVGADTLNPFLFTGALMTGNYFAASLGITFARLSKKLLNQTEDRSQQSLIDLFGAQAKHAWTLVDGVEVQILVENLKKGDIILAHAGETIAVDGMISAGVATIDQHSLTGEAQAVEKGCGDPVFAATVVLAGQLQVTVEKAGQETVAAQIGEILNHTVDFKNSIQSWGEKIADKSAQATLAATAFVLPFWGPATAVTILNTGFGLCLRILGPLSMLSFLNRASQQGILIKDGRSLQLLTEIDTVVFDKTGTLTLEQPHVAQIYPVGAFCEDRLLTYAAAAEYKQTHPIAKAICAAAHARALALPAINEASYLVGYGLTVHIPCSLAPCSQGGGDTEQGEDVVRVGSQRFMAMAGIALPNELQRLQEESQAQGHASFIFVAVNGQLAGALELHATLRPEAREVIRILTQRKLTPYIISGDHEQPTKRLAQEVGIDHYFAETLPESKADLIAKLQAEGKSVCFVGDGINDAIALKKAQVSVSLCGASSVATDTAQVILMNQDLKQLVQILDIAQAFKQNMQVNVLTTILPGLLTVYGAFFLGFGLTQSVILNSIGLLIGTSNASWPWLKAQQKKLSNATGERQRRDQPMPIATQTPAVTSVPSITLTAESQASAAHVLSTNLSTLMQVEHYPKSVIFSGKE